MQDLHSEGWRDAINKKKGLDIHHLREAFKVGRLVLSLLDKNGTCEVHDLFWEMRSHFSGDK